MESKSVPPLGGRGSNIAIIGTGALGSGIGQVAAMAGHDVHLYDSIPASVNRAKDNIDQSLNKLLSKGKITQDEMKNVSGRIHFLDQIEQIIDCDLIIEAIIESDIEKKKLYQRIESIVSPEAIIATNTSSLSVTGLASILKNPSRFIGVHFFNPPALMKLVEIIPAIQT